MKARYRSLFIPIRRSLWSGDETSGCAVHRRLMGHGDSEITAPYFGGDRRLETTFDSKANDALIAQTVVEGKTGLGEIREQVGNVE
ncbi:MAG: hypothetical protein ACRCXD_12750 [Luteolibacter sp.]